MPKTRIRHKAGSHSIGQAVEFIGKDKKSRGLGIVLAETNSSGYSTVDWKPDNIEAAGLTEYGFNSIHEMNEEYITCCKVFWQISQVEEIIHKSFLRIVPDTIKMVKTIRK